MYKHQAIQGMMVQAAMTNWADALAGDDKELQKNRFITITCKQENYSSTSTRISRRAPQHIVLYTQTFATLMCQGPEKKNKISRHSHNKLDTPKDEQFDLKVNYSPSPGFPERCPSVRFSSLFSLFISL